jgi:hypothetical protein
MNSIIKKTYVIAVFVAGLAGTLLLSPDGLRQEWLIFLALLVLAALSGSQAVRIPRLKVQLTAADMFTFCAIATLAPMAAPVVAMAGVLGAQFGPDRQPFSEKTIFNIGAVMLAASGAAKAYGSLLGNDSSSATIATLALLATAVIYLALNLTLVVVAVALEKKSKALGVLSITAPKACIACLTSLVLALGLVLAMEAIGPAALVLGLFGTAPLLAYFREHKRQLDGTAAA